MSARVPRRMILAALAVASLACGPWSRAVDGPTPSWIVYPLLLLVGLWRLRGGRGAAFLALAATVFLLVHLPWTWSAVMGERAGSVPRDLAIHRVEWLVTLFAVPLLTALAGFGAWRARVDDPFPIQEAAR